MEEDEELKRAIETSLSSYGNHANASHCRDYTEDIGLNQAIHESTRSCLDSSVTNSHHTKEEEDDEGMDQAILESFNSHSAQQQQQQQQQLQLQEHEELSLEGAIYESINSHKRQKILQAMNAHATTYQMQRSEEIQQGSWDCPTCTLVNQPYQLKCEACGTDAPKHVLTFQQLPDIQFGLEIEIVLTHGKSDGFTYESIAQSLTEMGPHKVEYMGYSHQTTNCWKMVTDSSIQENNINKDLCFELVSPVLRGTDGLSQLRSIMTNVRKLGIASNTSCGFHVHVDAEPGSMIQNVSALRSICQCYVSLENAFDLIVTTDSYAGAYSSRRQGNSNTYCRSNRVAFGSMSNRQRWDRIQSSRNICDLVYMMNPNSDRYRKLNLTNLINNNRPSTIEFRHHGGVEHLQEAEIWVRLILLFCQNAVLDKSKKNACILAESATVKEELRALFSLVGCLGLEQVYTVNRKLFVEERLQNAEWRCLICHKKFSNSRSLSQHCTARGH